VIVDGLRQEAVDGCVMRVAEVRRDGFEDHEVPVTVPADFAPEHADDATGLLPLCLLIAMRHGEPLRIEGRVEPDLLDRVDAIQRLYRAMDPELRLVELHVADVLPPAGPAGAFAGSCLSRGVDSLHAAALGRSPAGPIDLLVYADALEPEHDEAVRGEERALAERAAAALGLPLVICEAPLRELTDGVFDWTDAVGAGPAWIGHALSGGLGRLVVPSTDSILSLVPNGTSPALEPLLGSRALALEHGEVALTRMGKVAWLAEQRPDLLEFLKVCTDPAAGAGNCGRCAKCVNTMACLRAAGALEQASLFPSQLDPDAITSTRWPMLSNLVELEAIHAAAADARDEDLATAVQQALHREAERSRLATWGEFPASFTARHSNRVLTLVREGPVSEEELEGRSFPVARIGLVRALDRRSRRHVYSAGGWPEGEIVAELGALLPRETGEVPLWIGADGSVGTDRYLPPAPPLGPRTRARHLLAPLRRRDCEESLGRRLRDAVRPRRPQPEPGEVGLPVGSLHDQAGAGRVALWSGVHPVIGDQLLASSREEIEAAGYAGATLLGYLTARAPLTGRLGPWGVAIPWA
jgi:hypothetical protein